MQNELAADTPMRLFLAPNSANRFPSAHIPAPHRSKPMICNRNLPATREMSPLAHCQ